MDGIADVPRWSAWLTAGSLCLAAAAMVASQLGAPAKLCWDTAWTTAAVAALSGTVVAWRAAHPTNRRRWGRWAIAVACWLGGQLAWDVYGVAGFPQSPNVADLLWFAFALMVIASLVGMPEEGRLVRVVDAIESLALIVAAVALCFAALWPVEQSSTLPLAAKVSALFYPTIYVSAAVLLVHEKVGGALQRLNSTPLRLVVFGLVAQAVAFGAWSYSLLKADYVVGRTLLDPLWVIGMAAIAVGGLLAARRPEEPALALEPTYRGGIVPAGLLVLFMIGLGISHIDHAGSATTTMLESGLAFCAVALVVRATILGTRLKMLLDSERRALSALAERESELARLNEELMEDSRLDPLTGISNRRALADDLPMLEAVRRELGRGFAFALCDIDYFKLYNDGFGHLAGDQALRTTASTIRGALRTGDMAYRFGGEELLVVMRDVSVADAASAAERIRLAVERAALPSPLTRDGILTVSIGVAAEEEDSGRLLELADAAVYEAKNRGRNCVVTANEEALEIGVRQHPDLSEEPAPRHLRSMLAISRAAASGRGTIPVLDALAEAIHTEMCFQVVAVNVTDSEREQLRVEVVRGDPDARDTLLGTAGPLSEWTMLLAAGQEICGATWLPAGSFEWHSDTAVWTPPGLALPTPDAWQPEDMLLLPLRGSSGELLGVVSVDQPLLGRRPTEGELRVLMAVIDHASLTIERAQRDGEVDQSPSRELTLAAVTLLAEAVDLRDPSTGRHARTVGELARAIAVALGVDGDRVERIAAAGVLHDLGKLGIADAVLYKPGPLDEGEWREIMRHPEIGAEILEHAGMHDIAAWVRAHHERLDGGGYPARLGESEIPLEARILAVADAYEAMIADRPYRRGMPTTAARTELLRCAGTQFDPEIVEAFLSLDGEISATSVAQNGSVFSAQSLQSVSSSVELPTPSRIAPPHARQSPKRSESPAPRRYAARKASSG